MKEKHKSKKDKKLLPVIYLLRGRTPIMEDKRMQFVYYIITALFWTFVVWRIGVWVLSIPGVSNLFEFFHQNKSP